MNHNPDPERSKGALERVDPRHYGDDGGDVTPDIAPPCEICGRRESDGRDDQGRLVCDECAVEENDE